jgi:hypothetical protein
MFKYGGKEVLYVARRLVMEDQNVNLKPLLDNAELKLSWERIDDIE